MNELEDLLSLSDTSVLQCLIWGEARGEDIESMIAVANVVKNRVFEDHFVDQNWKAVMLKRKQFSCFNPGDPNLTKILTRYPSLYMDDPVWKTCRWVAHGVMYDFVPDNTEGANHYCVITTEPYWAKGHDPVTVIGSHEFYLL